MAVHNRMYNTTVIKKNEKTRKKTQNFTDGRTKRVKRVIKYPRLCMMFVHSRTMSIAFINCKKGFVFIKTITLSELIFYFVLKPAIKQFDVQCMVYLNLIII